MPNFDGLMDPEGGWCSCDIGRIYGEWHDEETYTYLKIGEQYLGNLKKSTEPIPLYALSYPEIFDRYPIEIYIYIRLIKEGVGETEWTERCLTANALSEQMVAEMTEDIGSELNLKVSVGNTYIRILRGERYEEGTDNCVGDFDRAVMDSYNGKFW